MKQTIYILGIMILLCLSIGCNHELLNEGEGTEDPKELPDEPKSEYKVVSIEFEPIGTGFDTIPGKISVTKLENPGDDTLTVTRAWGYKQLTVSHFSMPDEELPANSRIDTLLTSIPYLDHEPKIIGLTDADYPFAFNQKLYFEREIGDTITVQVPPRSIYVVGHQFTGFAFRATYRAVVEDTRTGEQTVLTGVWEGLHERQGSTFLAKESL